MPVARNCQKICPCSYLVNALANFLTISCNGHFLAPFLKEMDFSFFHEYVEQIPYLFESCFFDQHDLGIAYPLQIIE